MAQQKAIVMENVTLMKFLEDALDYGEKRKEKRLDTTQFTLVTDMGEVDIHPRPLE
jgi:hypothetical protein